MSAVLYKVEEPTLNKGHMDKSGRSNVAGSRSDRAPSGHGGPLLDKVELLPPEKI